jgi:hypothetical protein
MRKVNEIKGAVLSHPGRYREVYPEGKFSKDPDPLKPIFNTAEKKSL